MELKTPGFNKALLDSSLIVLSQWRHVQAYVRLSPCIE
jgi:hypothetical protein